MSWVLFAAALLGVAALGWYSYKQYQRQLRLETRLGELDLQQSRDAENLAKAAILQKNIFQAVGEGLLLVEGDHALILEANSAALKLLGKNAAGETVIAALRSYELDQLVREGREQPNEVAEGIVDLNNRAIRARVLFASALDQAVVTLRDESELQRLGRARREMVANISHELRTPITTIGLLADTLISGALKKPKRSEKLVLEIRREVDTLTHLVQEMRDLSLIESGQMPAKMMPVQLLSLVNSSVDPLRSLAERKAQQIAINVPETLEVLADFNQVMRVIKNIVHNGIKFAPNQGSIRIQAQLKDSDEALIAIYNNGPGVPPADLPRIFERFFQVDRSRSDGTGLGLAIARHIVLSHGGNIWAENDPNTPGISFYFTLPLAE